MHYQNQLKPRKKPTQERSKETVDIILKAAIQVFERKGYTNTTTNHIASRAGVSIGTIYQYFPNKNSILYELMDRHIKDVDELIKKYTSRMESGTPFNEEIIRDFIEILVIIHNQEPVHEIIMDEVPQAKQYILSWAKNTENKAVRLIEKILANTPNSRRKNNNLAAIVFVHTINALIHHSIILEREKKLKAELVEELADMLQRYLFH